MNERLLQFIWQFRHFNSSGLLTTDGEPVQIIQQGAYNSDQGPDFSNAKIRIGSTTWAGNIELHVLSSNWDSHRHSSDANYNNVVLHVVWEHDTVQKNSVPVIELQDRVSKILLGHYSELMSASSFIPCEKNITVISDIAWMAWKERLMIERLQRKAEQVIDLQKLNNNHWEETFWWMIARNFGIKVNSDAFEAIARSIPITVLAKHKQQIHQVEALLFGQAGLLTADPVEDYTKLLQREYIFLQKKYALQPVHVPVFFLRMRPANFPSVRLAQLAMLVHQSVHLFSSVKEAASLKEVGALLNITANDHWHYHYMLDEPSAFSKKKLGRQMVDNILINTVIPMLYAYGYYHKENSYKEKALQWSMGIAAEKNNISKGFSLIGVAQKNAFDTQALIQLKNGYCNEKRCLDCAVGNKILDIRP